jgi:hypothetical protein
MIIDEEVYLEHYGVKGMKWGVRQSRPNGVSRSMDRRARKDAEEFARAKMYYGKGAGNRRKLINASVSARSANNPGYAKAFQRHLDNQDMSRHAERAQTERSRTDRREATRQTAGFFARRFTGEMGTRAAFAAVAVAGATFLNSPQGRQFVNQAASTLNNAANRATVSQGARQVDDFFRNFGS